MEPWHTDPDLTLWDGDCLDAMRSMADNSVDSIVTDPPYGLGFMGKAWDDLPPGLPWAQECLRVLKPGSHLLAFGGTRTWHRLACAVEDAGFEVRDSLAWLYGSGFPKSLDVAKAIDKAAGVERVRNLVPTREGNAVRRGKGEQGATYGDSHGGFRDESAPATDAARTWQGWGTALKPAFEPIVVARKPLAGTVATNVLTHGTGALNIDGCRVGTDSTQRTRTTTDFGMVNDDGWVPTPGTNGSAAGRWPANVVLSDDQAAELDRQSGTLTSGYMRPEVDRSTRQGDAYGVFNARTATETYGDSGGASRFFPTFRYQAKAPTSERPRSGDTAHPTVKPLELMRWLVRLVTPPGGVCLDPFAGSGTTVEACLLEGMVAWAIEREEDYLPLIVQRVVRAHAAR